MDASRCLNIGIFSCLL